MIAGLEDITEGELYIDDKLVNSIAPSDRDIAMVFQNYALYGNMTLYENMGFSLTVRHKDSDEIHEKVMKAADIVELTEELNRKPSQISGGQSQRVALGRSIVRSAKVFLLDEPLSNLDAKLRTETRKELVKLHRKLKTTFIYVTHDQIEAITMADRMVILNDGIIQQVGSPVDVYDKPSNMFVAGFIGTPPMNFIEGNILNGSFVSPGLSFQLTDEQKKRLAAYENQTAILGIRPEDIMDTNLLPTRTADMISLNAALDVVELLGADMLAYFTINDRTLAGRMKASSNFTRGQKVSLTILIKQVHFFDPLTTERIEMGGTLCNG
jgi:multiple sugar transport system ATP-binding protein